MSASDHLTLECERNTKSLVEKFLNMQSEKYREYIHRVLLLAYFIFQVIKEFNFLPIWSARSLTIN